MYRYKTLPRRNVNPYLRMKPFNYRNKIVLNKPTYIKFHRELNSAFKIKNIEEVNNFLNSNNGLSYALLKLIPLLKKGFNEEYTLDCDGEFVIVTVNTKSDDGAATALKLEEIEDKFDESINDYDLTGKILLTAEFI